MDYYVIELTRDIPNPAKDGRSKDWNKLPVIPAGKRLIVSEDSLRSADGGGYGWESRRSTLGLAIEANAAKVEPKTVREMATVYNCEWGGDEILRILLKLGRITPADFEAVGNVPEDF